MQMAVTANIPAQTKALLGICAQVTMRSSNDMLLMPLRYGKETSAELYKFGA